VILPQFYESSEIHKKYEQYSLFPEGFVYSSDGNKEWLTVEGLEKMVKDLGLMAV